MKVLVGPIHLPPKVDYSNLAYNPGLGGSEYQALLLSSYLGAKFDVELWSVGSLPTISGVNVVSHPAKSSEYVVHITISGAIQLVHELETSKIVISHHPFDKALRNLPDNTIGVAHVGAYQLRSNLRYLDRVVPSLLMPVFLRACSAEIPDSAEIEEGFVVGHLSSLHPSKGFHDVLRGWMSYKDKGGAGTLEVVGGIGLYGSDADHSELPVSRAYGQKLLKIMGGEVHESVRFKGVVAGDIQCILRRWKIAILNPKGLGESESVAMKDCWRAGVPVITGDYFGHRDYMKDFPSLTIKNWRGIAGKLRRISHDESFLLDKRMKAFNQYLLLLARSERAKQSWLRIVECIADGIPFADLGEPLPEFKLSEKVQLTRDFLYLRLHDLGSHIVSRMR